MNPEAPTDPKSELQNLIDAIQNRAGQLKVMNTAQRVDRAKVTRLVKRYPEAAADLATEIEDAGIKIDEVASS
jgi:hypothetical protein